MALNDLFTGYGNKVFPVPDIMGMYKGKNLVVVGDAWCVWDDLDRFECRVDSGRGSVAKQGWDFMTINKMVEMFPGNIEHAFSNEALWLVKFVEARRVEYRREFTGPAHTHAITKGARWRWPYPGHGTSALGAILAGLGMGYEKIVLCGVPLDNGPHNGEPHWRKCTFTSEAASPQNGGVNQTWKRAMQLGFEGRVSSMSGRTRDWLGSPLSSAAAPASATVSMSIPSHAG